MGPKHINSSRLRGRFVKGESGNPRGRPKGASGRAAELKRLEEDALTLAVNAVDAIAETTRRTLAEIELKELIPLFNAITGAAKDAVKVGQIGPSSVALHRSWYDDNSSSIWRNTPNISSSEKRFLVIKPSTEHQIKTISNWISYRGAGQGNRV